MNYLTGLTMFMKMLGSPKGEAKQMAEDAFAASPLGFYLKSMDNIQQQLETVIR